MFVLCYAVGQGLGVAYVSVFMYNFGGFVVGLLVRPRSTPQARCTLYSTWIAACVLCVVCQRIGCMVHSQVISASTVQLLESVVGNNHAATRECVASVSSARIIRPCRVATRIAAARMEVGVRARMQTPPRAHTPTWILHTSMRGW